jgi:hypothetical protein
LLLFKLLVKVSLTIGSGIWVTPFRVFSKTFSDLSMPITDIPDLNQAEAMGAPT